MDRFAIVYKHMAAAVLLLLLCLPLQSAHAQDVFTIENVEVDTTAEDATSARDAALVQGQNEAFALLVERMVPETQRTTLPQATPDDINKMVASYSVADEKISSTRYRARLTITFNPELVRQFLQGANVSYTEAAPKTPILVLPVLIQNNRPVLWEEPNPWRDSWNAMKVVDRLVTITLPLGDLEDMQGGELQAVLAKDYDRLAPLRMRYQTDDILVATATVTGHNPDGTLSLDVVLDLLGKYENKRSSANYTLNVPETDMLHEPGLTPDLFTPIAQDVVRKLDKQWRASTMISGGGANIIPVLVPVSGLEEWMDIRRKLVGAPQVESIQILALSAGQADIVLHYRGELSTALEGIAHYGLSIQQENGYWVLRRTGV